MYTHTSDDGIIPSLAPILSNNVSPVPLPSFNPCILALMRQCRIRPYETRAKCLAQRVTLFILTIGRLAHGPKLQVFQHFLWAHDSNSLRTALEHKLHDKLRVLRPLIRGEGAQRRTIYGILSRGGLGQHNREAERIQEVKVRLMGPMWLLCRSGGRYIRDYSLTDYVEDILRGQDSS